MKTKKTDLLRAEMRKGRWTLLSKDGDRWLCRCECGTLRSISAHSLAQGTSQSCGCLRRERLAEYNLTPTKRTSGDRILLTFSDDEFELPFVVADTIPEMSRILGVSYSTVIRCLSSWSRRINIKGVGWCKVVYIYI